MKVIVVGIADFSFLAQNLFLTMKKRFPLTEFHDIKKYRRIVKYINKDFDFNIFRKRLYRLKPELIVIVAPYYLKKEYYEIITNYKSCYSCIVSGWIGDKFDINQTTNFITNTLDKKFITDSYFYDLYEDNDNITYLPLCTSKDIFYKNHKVKKNFSTFIASNTPYRQNMLERIEFSLNVFGTGWKSFKKTNKNLNLNINAKKLFIYDVAKQYNNSKTVLNLTNENNIVNGLNQRSFDPFLCNSLVLQENCKDLELSFEPGKEIVSFSTIAELNEKMSRYEKDRKSYQIILEKGKKRVLSEHTFDNRVEKILNTL